MPTLTRLPLRLLLPMLLLAAPVAQARVLTMQVAKLHTPVATLAQVRLQLQWPDGASEGELQLWAGRVDAPGLGYHYQDLHWRCPLQRTATAGWQCAGALRAGGLPPVQLAVQLDAAGTRAQLAQGSSRMALERLAATPDVTTLELQRLPLAWAQALLAQAWPAAQWRTGMLDGRLQVVAATAAPLRVQGRLGVSAAGFETADAGIAAEKLTGSLQLDYRSAATDAGVQVAGQLHGGEFLAGNTYVSLPATPVAFQLGATRTAGAGWVLPDIRWQDGDTLQAQASARLTADGGLAALAVHADSRDMTPLKPRYLSGWMGLFGLRDVDLHGAMELDAALDGAGLATITARLHDVDVRDPNGRFVFDGLRGDLRYTAAVTAVESALQWQRGQLYGLAFGAAALPFASSQGELRTRAPVRIPMMDGTLGLRDVVIRPPQGAAGLEVRFGLQLESLDFGKISQALGLPAFQGKLGGSIPRARYANDRIDFDGGLGLQLFDGQVAFSQLALERPFGTAPSLSADIALDDLDLLRLTEVLGFGSITGKLDGRIRDLRLVDWTPVAFDARFITDDAPGVRKRISQRAVQDIGSVGGGSFIQTLQGQAIALFKDFGYRRIGIGCHLENQICTMNGLHSDGNAFTIVEGAGVPRLEVVGYNRAVDWQTLVERLLAASKGDVAPVIH
ncbi:MAG: hypothetical protein KGL91_02565 [Xanthomonadaceae bacterium]|nr:hypothetical protein [Xanthomonadaceae bacterium]